MSGIYAYFDSDTLECLYVGQTSFLPHHRHAGHLKKLKLGTHPRKDWVAWYKLHGTDPGSMIFTWIEDCGKDMLNAREARWFVHLEPRFYGKRPSENEVWMHCEETRLKIAESVRIARGNVSGRNKPKWQRRSAGQTCKWPKLIAKVDLQRLYVDEQKSLRQIAALYEVSHITVRNHMLDYRIPMRYIPS